MSDLDFGTTIKGFSPGQKVFSRYTLARILGRGGMGVVWLARDDKLEREVALKFLPEILVLDPKAIDELKREAKRNLDLTHPHIVRIHDFVDDIRVAAIAMEYVDGSTLSKLSLEQPGRSFSPEALETWVRQLCSALDYAHHDARVVHRDLKPANLMVDGRGRLKVTDFGIATSIADSVSRVSKQAGTSGTPVYMSPQQMMGEKPAVTDDVYAIGATLYELLTGKPPFHTGNVILQVQSKVPPSLTERRKELGVEGGPIPQEWEETIAACLAKEPKDRPQSAGAVLERLGLDEKAATKPKVEPSTPSLQRRASTPAPGSNSQAEIVNRKSNAPLYAGLAVAVLVLSGLGWYFGVHAPEQKRLAEIARLEAEGHAAEAARLRTEQEKAAAAVKAETERLAAAAKAKAEEEQRAYAVIVTKIDALVVGSTAALRAATETAVKNYLSTAPSRYHAEVETRWSDRQTAWEDALQKDQARLAAERLAAARGGIVVRTNPAGAEVRVGAVALEKSPLTLKDQKLGKYPVRIRLDGYEEWTGEVDVKENDFADLDVVLVRSTGRVVLTGTQGATVMAQGRTLGTLPLTLDRVPTGAVRYTLSLKDHKSVEVSGELSRNSELRLSASLERQPFPQPGQPWENTLGQKFVPVPGTNVLFCLWETRVQDFEAFVRETNYDATAGAKTLNALGQYDQINGSWRQPGFTQTGLHPVSCLLQVDAEAFCRWLTGKERREGRLAADQEYRLPTDAEWDAAVGKDEFPWGSQWVPPPGAGNFSDATAKRTWPVWTGIPGYDDGYAGTAPVGSYAPNRLGLYDLGGNVWELIGDRQNGIRGASFCNVDRIHMPSSYRDAAASRLFSVGFRVVCAVGASR